MALQTFNPPVNPNIGARNQPELKLLKADFGDGYSQTTGAGMNHVRQVVDLTWENLTLVEAEIILDFIEGHGGTVPFLWTRPARRGQQLRWTCEKWTDEDAEAGRINITATFRQDFNLDG